MTGAVNLQNRNGMAGRLAIGGRPDNSLFRQDAQRRRFGNQGHSRRVPHVRFDVARRQHLFQSGIGMLQGPAKLARQAPRGQTPSLRAKPPRRLWTDGLINHVDCVLERSHAPYLLCLLPNRAAGGERTQSHLHKPR